MPMPLGYYGSPLYSSYSNPYTLGPYANHSSIIAANYIRTPSSTYTSKPLSRLRSGFTPFLATINETHAASRPMTRITSPKLVLHSSPKFKMPRPIAINTADIDVSVNKYRKFKPTTRVPEKSEFKRKEPENITVSTPPIETENNEERTPGKSPIKRDRALVRLHTIHRRSKDKLPQKEENALPKFTRKWRDAFEEDEKPVKIEKKVEKSPAERLLEKHLIKDKTEEEKLRLIEDQKNKRTKNYKKYSNQTDSDQLIRKSPSFQEICESISLDTISEDLNPGQPEHIKRRQTRLLSTEDILSQVRKNSAEFLNENVIIVDKVGMKECLDKNNDEDSGVSVRNREDSRTSVKRKKKITRKKTSENLGEESDSKDKKVARRKTNENLLQEDLDTKDSNSKIAKRKTSETLLENSDTKDKKISRRRTSENLVEELDSKEKKVTRRKTSENLVDDHQEMATKPTLQRRPTLRKIKRTTTDHNLPLALELDERHSREYQNAICDISQVEVEEIKVKRKPKPVITATVDVESTKSNLKAIVDEVYIEETPTVKSPKFKLEFTIENIEEEDNKADNYVNKLPNKNAAETIKNETEAKLKKTILTRFHDKNQEIVVGKDNTKEESSTPEQKLIKPKESSEEKQNFANKEKKKVDLEIKEKSKPVEPALNFLRKQEAVKKSDKVVEDKKEVDKVFTQISKPIAETNKNEKTIVEPKKTEEETKKQSKQKEVETDESKTSPTVVQEDKKEVNKVISQISIPSVEISKKEKTLVETKKTKEETQKQSKESEVKIAESKTLPTVVQKVDKVLNQISKPSAEMNKKVKTLVETTKTEKDAQNQTKTEESKITENKTSPTVAREETSVLEKSVEAESNNNNNNRSATLEQIQSEILKTKSKQLEIANQINIIKQEIEKKRKKSLPVEEEISKNDAMQVPQSKHAIISKVVTKNLTMRKVDILDDVKEPVPVRKPKLGVKKSESKENVPVKKGAAIEKSASTDSVNFWDQIGTRETVQFKNRKNVERPIGEIDALPELEDSADDRVNRILNASQEKKSVPTLVEEEEEVPKAEKGSTEAPSCQEERPALANVEKAKEEEIKEENNNVIEKVPLKITSKRSLVVKASVNDPDLQVFVPPKEEPKVEEEKPEEGKFVPLQSNRLSDWMHPFQKPMQLDVCPIEIYAKPKIIRGRHYPRPKHPVLPSVSAQKDESSESDSSESEEDSSEEESESSEDETNPSSSQTGTSTSSNDSGFDSSAPGSPSNRRCDNDCDVNCHKKCERLTANLCGVNQKLIVEAIASVRKGSSENYESSTLKPALNPAFSLDSGDCISEDILQSCTFTGYKKSGRITPPATTMPRFRKYTIDDFQFLKVLGKGSFGKVMLAELKNTEYYYAVKCLKKDVVLEDDDVECTLIERKVLALGTKHPYLCHLLCTFQTESHLFFIMEYLNGGDLMFHIQQSGRFAESRAKFYAAEIASGLKFLHSKGIVYRDLKLDNILLDFDGHVRIADFGMCKLQIFLDRMADTFCGTPDYMAPEIIKGQHYNQCVDWWSYGVLLYEMLIGQSPFSGCDEDELFWSICNEKPVIPRFLSAEANSILLLLLEKDATKRLGNRMCPSGSIQDHPFFKAIDWERLEARMLEAPFKPKLQHPLDTQYFDKTFTVERAKLTPIEKNILQSMDQSQFQGFSYTNPNATDK